jgi:hypothetical protein
MNFLTEMSTNATAHGVSVKKRLHGHIYPRADWGVEGSEDRCQYNNYERRVSNQTTRLPLG